jgi:hypothetical protein
MNFQIRLRQDGGIEPFVVKDDYICKKIIRFNLLCLERLFFVQKDYSIQPFGAMNEVCCMNFDNLKFSTS